MRHQALYRIFFSLLFFLAISGTLWAQVGKPSIVGLSTQPWISSEGKLLSTRGGGVQGKFTSYPMPVPAAIPHCVAIDQKGIIWAGLVGSNRIGKFDPKTGLFKHYLVPTPDSRPHGITVDGDGKIWFTSEQDFRRKVGRFDPDTELFIEVQVAGIGDADVRPHTPIFGPGGYIWFTMEDGIGRIHPRTFEAKAFPVPTKGSRPYGITVGLDGMMYFAEWRGHKIGRLNPKTGEVREYNPPTPGSGTRRITTAPDGIIWVSEYIAHNLARFDPKSGEIREFKMPSAPNSAPYGIVATPDGMIWMSEQFSNLITKFDPKAETFTSYPVPWDETGLRIPSSVRNMITDREGKIWYGDNRNSRITKVE